MLPEGTPPQGLLGTWKCKKQIFPKKVTPTHGQQAAVWPVRGVITGQQATPLHIFKLVQAWTSPRCWRSPMLATLAGRESPAAHPHNQRRRNSSTDTPQASLFIVGHKAVRGIRYPGFGWVWHGVAIRFAGPGSLGGCILCGQCFQVTRVMHASSWSLWRLPFFGTVRAKMWSAMLQVSSVCVF